MIAVYEAAQAEYDSMLSAIASETDRAVAFVRDVQARELAEAARIANASQAHTNASQMHTGGGGHSDAWWHGVAICEQGGRNDPYYGYFSFMDGSQGGKPWDEQVAAGNALLARAGREVGPWAAACVAAGYRAAAW